MTGPRGVNRPKLHAAAKQSGAQRLTMVLGGTVNAITSWLRGLELLGKPQNSILQALALAGHAWDDCVLATLHDGLQIEHFSNSC
jgi:hypothetical protein